MRQIGKLVFKCICVMVPAIGLCLYAGLFPLAFVDGESPYYLWNKEAANTARQKQYDVLILGDSTANASYIPELLSDGALNLSLGGTTTVESYYILRDWLDHNPAPKACYISFLDQHLTEDECFWTRVMYTHRFRLAQDAEMLRAAAAYGETSILTEHWMLDFISYECCLPHVYITALFADV